VVTSPTDGLLIIHRGTTSIRVLRGMMMLVVAASMTGWMRRLAKGGRVSTHVAIMIIVARRCFARGSIRTIHATMLICGSDQDRVIGMCLDMLLEVLRTLERLATEITLVWLEGHMNSDMRGDVVAFDGCDPTLRPLTLQVQIIGAFSANMFLADMFI